MKESAQCKREYFFGRYNKVCDNGAVGVGAQHELTYANATGCGAQAEEMKVTRVTSVKIRWLRKTWSQSNGSNKTSGLFEGTACCRKVEGSLRTERPRSWRADQETETKLERSKPPPLRPRQARPRRRP